MKLVSVKTLLLTAALAAMLLTTPRSLLADATSVAICNPAIAMQRSKEYKDVAAAIDTDRKAVDDEAAKKANAIKSAQDQLGFVKPDSDQYAVKNKDVLEMKIQFEVWKELHQIEFDRQHKAQMKRMFDKVLAAIKTVANNEKIGLVISDTHVDLPENLENLKVEDVTQIIVRRTILYSDNNLDITDKVVLQLDKEYMASSTPR